MKRVRVFYSGWGERWPLGTLAESGKGILFEYDPEALRRRLELSPVHLKLGPSTYGNFPAHQLQLPGLISDALPDGWGLLLMDRVFKKQGLNLSQISALDRLSFLGNRAMGALVFEPIFEPGLEGITGFPDCTLLTLAQEVKKVVCDQATKVLPQLALIGGSPQGARPKVLVNYDLVSQVISTDPAGLGEPWLIKFQAAREHKEAPALEKLYADLAKKAGLRMSDCEYFDLGKTLSAFGTKRFDRENGLRVPVHSLAGVLHADFRLPSSVSYEVLLRLIRLMTQDEREVAEGFRQCAFNIVFGNQDDHPKNFSFRLEKNQIWKLAPCYDLTFSHGPGGEHQMDLFGEGKSFSRELLMKLGLESGLKEKGCREMLEQVMDSAAQFKKEAKKFPIRASTVAEVDAIIQTNSKSLR